MDKITQILRDFFDDDSIVASPQLTAGQVDGWDSLAHVRLVLTIERAFNIRFTAAEANSFANVGDLAAAVAAKTGARA